MRFDTLKKKIKNIKNTKEILERINYKKIIYCENITKFLIRKTKTLEFKKKTFNYFSKKKQNFLLNAPEKFTIGYSKIIIFPIC